MDFETLKSQVMGLYDELHATYVKLEHIWASNILFSWRWWIALSLVILPWTLWFIIRKRESADRLLYAGLIVMVVSSYMDLVGVSLNIWSYTVTVVPLMPSYIVFDLSTLPVTTMLFLQFFPKVKPIFKAIIFSLVGSFLYQPLMAWIGLYNEEGWKNYYSLPILFGLYLLADYFSRRKRFDQIV